MKVKASTEAIKTIFSTQIITLNITKGTVVEVDQIEEEKETETNHSVKSTQNSITLLIDATFDMPQEITQVFLQTHLHLPTLITFRIHRWLP